MINIEKLTEETMEAVIDVVHHCHKDETVINIIRWAIKEVADKYVQNVLEIYTPKEKK